MNEVHSFNLQSLQKYCTDKSINYHGEILRHIEARADGTYLYESFQTTSDKYINNHPELIDTQIGGFEACKKLGEAKYNIVNLLNKIVEKLNKAYFQYQIDHKIDEKQHTEICTLVADFVIRAANDHNISLPKHNAFENIIKDNEFQANIDDLKNYCKEALRYTAAKDTLNGYGEHGLYKNGIGKNHTVTRANRTHVITKTTFNLLKPSHYH